MMGPPSRVQYLKYSILKLLLEKSFHYLKLKCNSLEENKLPTPIISIHDFLLLEYNSV